ncbi:MAG: hypothetical protein H7316_02970 [Tardiphaga sp.]|uniref:hypothetical protein n=1 Tax=Tardiphaga sp. TaxID=1926292 RepID=UPI00199FA153|nr:hypothetical protein [Tardiphaga sp.]MBC7582694.1 hypothetical protein [Tardiphaga sp.]
MVLVVGGAVVVVVPVVDGIAVVVGDAVVDVVLPGSDAMAWAGTMIDCTIGRVQFFGSKSVEAVRPPIAMAFRTFRRFKSVTLLPPANCYPI